MSFAFAAWSLAFAGGCFPNAGLPAQFGCKSDSDCPAGQVCGEGICVEALRSGDPGEPDPVSPGSQEDGGAPDSGTPGDAATPDSAEGDASPEDNGPGEDASPGDAAPEDTASPPADTGPDDVISSDLDPPDSKPDDAPDGGRPDAISSDAEEPDGCRLTDPATELCDGVDNDCNPATPDGAEAPGVDTPCNTNLPGVCGKGKMLCISGKLECVQSAGPLRVDVCNGEDDDCNGQVDDNAQGCAGAQVCQEGKCVERCEDECKEEGVSLCKDNKVVQCSRTALSSCLKFVDVQTCGSTGCSNGKCVECTPAAKDPACAGKCGKISDGCGGLLECGGCKAGEACGVKTANLCSCAPENNTCANRVCGTFKNNCGDMIQCGHPCAAGSTCSKNGDACKTCPAGWAWFPETGNCYKMSTVQARYGEAERHCKDAGSHLVTISSPGENSFAAQIAGAGKYFWIGITDRDKENEWRWITGEAVTFKGWNPGEPNDYWGEDCGEMNSNQPAAGWNDTDCGERRWYVCEIENR
ncbi:MAG: hypothetical protein GMKNLPBB_00156 [Myxococcota bacterium]|nr:hypothetical protein [Myxococcota bacterium]